MNRRPSVAPPILHTPPPSTPSNNRSYKWTSMTAANCDSFVVDQTPEKKKADISWLSPSRGDTWRKNVPRGRIRNIAALFDNIAQVEVADKSEELKQSRRIRRISEPNYDKDEKILVETNFLDDSMMEGYEEEDRRREVFEDYVDSPHAKDEAYYQMTTAQHQQHQQPSYMESSHRCVTSYVHHIIGDGGDNNNFQSHNNSEARSSSIIDITPRRPSITSTRFNLIEREAKMNEANKRFSGFVTSTPQNLKCPDEASKYFGNEESIKASPSMRRERRGTQAIVVPKFEIDSPKSEKKFKAPLPKPTGTVKSMAESLENSDLGFHRKIDAAAEIAELRRNAEKNYDENSNVLDDSSDNRQTRNNVRMGISSLGYKPEDNDHDYYNMLEQRERAQEEGCQDQEDFYTIPRKYNDLNDSLPRMSSKLMRQSLPFSDIPEERTDDKIDEMFDFVEQKTCDIGDKTLERTDGYVSIDNRSNATNYHKRQMNMSNHTYQELELEKSNTRYVEHFENDGTGFTASTNSGNAPQFTRSPTLMTPHAGQSVTEYRVSEREGHAKTEKIVVNKSMTPSALATSTPLGTLAQRRGYMNNMQEDSFVSSISNMSTADKTNELRRQISKLIDMTEKTRRHIELAETALIDAKKSHLVVQELSAQRVLLVTRERLKLQLDEVKRLQALSVVRHPPPPLNRYFKSTMVISNISVYLNKNFNLRGSFAFIVALKCRTEIEATGVVTLLAHYQTRLNVIHFAEHLHFSNLPVDFVITMEVYMMKIPEYREPKKTCAAVLATKCKNLLVPSAAQRKTRPRSRNDSTISRQNAPKCDFGFCGKLTLDRDSAGDGNFYLDDVTYPLEGTVKLVSHCSSLPEAIDVEYRGFLYMYNEESLSGESVWEKFWAMLNRGIIFFWKKPEDEKTEQIPLSQIDLTKCTNDTIEPMKNTIHGKQHLFSVELLIDQTPALLEKRRVLLATESADHMNSWLNAINDTLLVLRS
ncbi:unnamed protein product [Caenorhabditis bovis]|uniref:PH domain-containing protein n=1 Tax=Caenorhabditis bovis TaxID=2654633 RepID=A0A8S1E810_9PELO|nr:unnamed protein product [Caenorhabditis bovis]